MSSPKLEVSVAFPGMVDSIPVSYFGEEWSWVFCERMQRQSIDDNNESLCLLEAALYFVLMQTHIKNSASNHNAE